MNSKKLLHIEKLRGISVLLVFLYHLNVPGFQFGFLGVDVFFVVSGYLMAMLYGEIASKDEILNFFIRRSGRLLPAYFTVLLTTAVFAVVLVLPHEIESLMKQGVWSSALLPNFGFWQHDAYFNSIMFRPLLNFWSLGVELQFYLVFPLLLFIKRVAEKWLLVFAVLSLVIALITGIIDPKTAFFMLPSRLWEFMVGYYTFRIVQKTKYANRDIGFVALLSLLGLLIGLSAYDVNNVFAPSLAVVLLSATAIALGFSTGSENNHLSRALIGLGKYSYSIYLVHFPIIVLVNYVPFNGNNLGIENPESLFAIVFATAVSAFFLHNLIETRTRHLLRGKHLVLGVAIMTSLFAISVNPAVTLSKAKLTPAAVAINNGREDRGSFQCDTSFDRRVRNESSCRLNIIESPRHSFMLFGDSHADMIKHSLLEVLTKNSQSLRYIKGYRPIMEGFERTSFVEEASKHQVQTIIIHQTLRPDNGKTLESFIKKAGESNIRVVFISPIPIYFFNVPQRLYEDYLKTGEISVEGMPRSAHYERTADLFANLKKFEEKYDNFDWYDGSENLCKEFCVIADEVGRPLYYDNNHLTLTGATFLTTIFTRISEL